MKWLDNIKSKYQVPKSFYAVNYHFGAGEDQLYLVKMLVEGEEVSVEFSKKAFSTTELFENMDKLPAVLLISGKKVLSKKITDLPSSYAEADILQSVYPNADPEQLVPDIQPAQNEGEAFVSVIRKDILKHLLKEWPADFQPISLNLAPVALSFLLPNQLEQPTPLGQYVFHPLEKNFSPSAESVNENICLLGETIPAWAGLAFLAGLRICALKGPGDQYPAIGDNFKEWQYGLLYRQVLIYGASGIFAILLLSFLVFSSYNAKNQSLAHSTRAYDSHMRDLETLKEQYQQKQSFIEINGQAGSMQGPRIDQVAALVPAKVSLESLAINPLQRFDKRHELFRYERQNILIRGEATAYNSFQNWLKELKSLPWVESLEIKGYQEQGSRYQAEFQIILEIEE